jgi:hypothetical protein
MTSRAGAQVRMIAGEKRRSREEVFLITERTEIFVAERRVLTEMKGLRAGAVMMIRQAIGKDRAEVFPIKKRVGGTAGGRMILAVTTGLHAVKMILALRAISLKEVFLIEERAAVSAGGRIILREVPENDMKKMEKGRADSARTETMTDLTNLHQNVFQTGKHRKAVKRVSERDEVLIAGVNLSMAIVRSANLIPAMRVIRSEKEAQASGKEENREEIVMNAQARVIKRAARLRLRQLFVKTCVSINTFPTQVFALAEKQIYSSPPE